MSIIKEKYETIAPQIEYLGDEVILAQAWKKATSYIRRHNWYADVLELDCSTIDLESRLKDWAQQITNETYQVDKMRLVLAPKNKQWYFSNNAHHTQFDSWSSRRAEKGRESSEQKLRPLAHLTIRDQTVATAVMLCLADAVETAQGPTDEKDFLAAQKQEVYSYGNRLHCDWKLYPHQRKQARFRWGNSRCYRQYYEDYKTFLQRPRSICQYYSSILPKNKKLYVVSLDLKEFYDHIDTRALIGTLRSLYNDYVKKYNSTQNFKEQKEFWSKVTEIFSWCWDENELKYKEIMSDKALPEGIPQGLVASGFLSNAYLVGFDQKVGARINDEDSNNSLILRDYCRYVDDIRLVVEVSNETELDKVKGLVEKMMGQFLEGYQKTLQSKFQIKLNTEKTKIIPYRQLAAQSTVSSQMNLFQNALSGTPDAEALRQVTGGLDGLLQIANQLENNESVKTNQLDLSKITTQQIDVRDDTLKRFVATRMVKSLRFRRSMTDLSEKVGSVVNEQNHMTAGQMLDHEFETAARKLIACWADNPALSLLLRCGLDLYPDPMILAPVIDALKTKLYNVPSKDLIYLREQKVAEYISADLLRAAATDVGYRSDAVYPDSADIQGFREELAIFAKEFLTEHSKSPWYVKQQAILFLISIGDYDFSVDFDVKEQELKYYALLQEAALYRSTPKVKVLDRLVVSLVMQQISPNSRKYTSWFIQWMNKMDTTESRKQAIQVVAMNRPDLMKEIINSKRLRAAKWAGEIPDEIRTLLNFSMSEEIILKKGSKVSLLRIIQSDLNPFKQENALLLLTQAILRDLESESMLSAGISVNDMMIECQDWGRIQNPIQHKNFLSVSYGKVVDIDLYKNPPWILEKCKWMYGLGRILRSCITGEFDFTSHAFLLREENSSYKGIKSTWFTRRFGINNHPRGLLSESSPISPWLSELLIRLLQWPGICEGGKLVQGFEQVNCPVDLLRLIEERLAYQSKIFGRLSGTPFYMLPAPTYNERECGKLQVAVVQPLLPKVSDFNMKDPTHWTPSFRAQHRNHIASICNLVNSHLKSTRSAQRTTNVSLADNKTKGVDLIVFPELTIHPDDTDLLRGLSDATKANIFAGLTFIRPSVSKNPINQALWLLRVERPTGREFMYVYQGKKHMTKPERKMGIQGYRPYQVLIELGNDRQGITRLAGAICYDATDLSLVADLREVSDVFVIAAMNQDVQTFDNMVAALHYHMYQPVILANTGEFGGSTAQAPFARHARQIAHIHGNHQVAVSIFEVDASAFKGNSIPPSLPEVKTPPAGYKGRD